MGSEREVISISLAALDPRERTTLHVSTVAGDARRIAVAADVEQMVGNHHIGTVSLSSDQVAELARVFGFGA